MKKKIDVDGITKGNLALSRCTLRIRYASTPGSRWVY